MIRFSTHGYFIEHRWGSDRARVNKGTQRFARPILRLARVRASPLGWRHSLPCPERTREGVQLFEAE